MYIARLLKLCSAFALLGFFVAVPAHVLTAANLLTDPGFNTPLTNPLITHFAVLGAPFTQDTWGQENSSVVPAQGGVTPQEGNGMLRMDDDGLNVTQIWQRVSVSSFAAQIDAGLATADLSAWFNIPGGFTGAVSSVRIAFVDASNVEISGVNVQSPSIGGIDANPATWQLLPNLGSAVPVGTRILEAQFNYVNATMQGQPGYVDAADMRLTVIPEPATCMLLLISLAGVVAGRRS